MKNEEEKFMFTCIVRKPKIYSVVNRITAQDVQDAIGVQDAVKNFETYLTHLQGGNLK